MLRNLRPGAARCGGPLGRAWGQMVKSKLKKAQPEAPVKQMAPLRDTGPTSHGEIGSHRGQHRVLVVDDEKAFLRKTGNVLREEGYDVVLARSGEEAIDLVAAEPVDCILLDLMVPGMGGRAVCQEIKSTPKLRDIPLILLTPTEDRGTMLDGLGIGADDCIAKSSEVEVLKARVRAQVRRKQFEDENRHIREELLRKEFDAAEAHVAQEVAETRAALVAELERKNKELEAFGYSVSHDLRAPLRAIDGFSKALMEDFGEKLDAEGLEHLQRVRAAAQRMGELIDDMLQLSRVTRHEIRRRRVDLSSLAQEVADELKSAGARTQRRVQDRCRSFHRRRRAAPAHRH